MVISVSIERTVDTDLPVNVRKGIRKYLREGMSYGFAISQEEAPEDRGQLRRSGFGPEWRQNELVWGYDAPHARPQEEGTAPFTPPVKPLIEWGERVAGDPGVGMAAWHKIRKEGIEPKEYMQAGAEASIDWFSRNSPDSYIEDEF